MFGDFENWTSKFKNINFKALQSSYSRVFFTECGCGFKKPKPSVWALLAFLGLFLYFL